MCVFCVGVLVRVCSIPLCACVRERELNIVKPTFYIKFAADREVHYIIINSFIIIIINIITIVLTSVFLLCDPDIIFLCLTLF